MEPMQVPRDQMYRVGLKAYERMLKSDVKYRFVIDMASLKAC
jgi:D-arabinose 1-dehydrogenase-like Zn-dependent alcohol dehydrogenase